MKKATLRIMLLGAALSAVSFTGMSYAADDTTPAKPATPAPTTPPARQGRGNFDPAEMLKTYRDRFEGITPALTDDQMKKIDGFIETAEAEVKKNAGSTDPEARRASFGAIRKLGEDVNAVLTDEQKTAIRAKRTAAMFDQMKTTYTADNLKLTDDQKTKITAIIDEAKKAALAAPPPAPDANGGRQRGGGFAAMREARDKINAVLTPEQQKEIPTFGGPGGGRGNRGGNPPAGGTTPPPTPPAKTN
jgi:Spy/CpxP family protein refolding chaperone